MNLQEIRNSFPALSREVNGRKVIYMDGPGGTQVPTHVINAIEHYYNNSNSNTHGLFTASEETDQMMTHARKTMAVFLNAESASCISFGQNMTSLTFSLARGIGRMLEKGDEIIITKLDHEANRGPWLSLKEFGITVKEVEITRDGQLDYEHFGQLISSRTRLVAVGAASNAIGTINDLQTVRKISHEAGAMMFVDAVHLAPHRLVDVQQIGCDFLACSAYKFFGPHVGILYCREGLLEQIPVDRLKTQDQEAPYIIETGTLNHAAIAGSEAAVQFIATMGSGSTLRERLSDAYSLIRQHESELFRILWEGLEQIQDVQLVGLPPDAHNRTPTIALFHPGNSASDIAGHLGKHGIYAWDGHFYAQEAVDALGYLQKGGVTRLGISAYTTEEEIQIVIDTLKNYF